MDSEAKKKSWLRSSILGVKLKISKVIYKILVSLPRNLVRK